MRVMSLFAGYGGLDLALGMVFPEARTVYVSDIEEGRVGCSRTASPRPRILEM